jgi:hypothetical protein
MSPPVMSLQVCAFFYGRIFPMWYGSCPKIADCQLPIANLKKSNRHLEIGSEEIGNRQLAIGNDLT